MKSGKWNNKKKEKKGKSKSIEESIVDSSKLFNPNPNSIKTFNYSPLQRSHKTNFMLDSGATSHFVSEKKLLTNFTKDKIYIKLADNSKTSSEGYGNMYWKTLD